jgi:hypothetical protein
MGNVLFRCIPENPSSSLYAASNGADVPDETWRPMVIRSLDSLLADGTLGPVDFIKLDAETYGVEIVKDGRELFKGSRI